MTREEQIKQASLDNENYILTDNEVDCISFQDGARWADSNPNWIDINEQQPPEGVEVNAFNKEWIDEDFNPNGTRVGFMTDHGFCSALWWDYQDDYIAISAEKVASNPEFYSRHKGKTEPTHWMPIVPPKFD